MLSGATPYATGIEISLRLGRHDSESARQIGYTGLVISLLMCGLMLIAGLVTIKSPWFGMAYHEEAFFLERFLDNSWIPFAIALFFGNCAAAVESMLYAMGRTKDALRMKLVASWGCQVPAVIFFVKYWKGSLVPGIYTGLSIGYGLLTVLYVYVFLSR